MDEPTDVLPIRLPMPSRKEFDRLVAKANGGDAQAIQELRRVLDEHPQIWRRVGDLSAVAGNSMLRMASGGNRLIRSSIARYVAKMRKELQGDAPTRLERLAIERVLLAWVQSHHVDAVVTSLQNVSAGTLSSWLKRQRQASGELDRALRSLATFKMSSIST